ncbi:MAG: tetratricopeptide repeat protein [Chitinispirillaceae bacterium]
MSIPMFKSLFVAVVLFSTIISCSTTYQKKSSMTCKQCESEERISKRIECYTAMIRRDSGNAELYLRRASHYADFMLYQPALEDYLKSYEILPKDSSIVRNIACMYARLGNIEQASEWFGLSEDDACVECLSEKRHMVEKCMQRCNQFHVDIE